MIRGTIETTFITHQGSQRVRFSCPEDGYNVDDLDALIVAARIARAKLLELHSKAESKPSLAFAYIGQQSRLSAPS